MTYRFRTSFYNAKFQIRLCREVERNLFVDLIGCCFDGLQHCTLICQPGLGEIYPDGASDLSTFKQRKSKPNNPVVIVMHDIAVPLDFAEGIGKRFVRLWIGSYLWPLIGGGLSDANQQFVSI